MVAISLMPNYFGVTLCDIFQQFNGREISGCRISVKQKLSQAPTFYSGNFIPPQNRSARCCLLLHTRAQLCSALPIPHSSLPLVHFALKSYQIDRININFHKNAKNHLKPIDIPLWVWYSIDTLKHTKRLGLI